MQVLTNILTINFLRAKASSEKKTTLLNLAQLCHLTALFLWAIDLPTLKPILGFMLQYHAHSKHLSELLKIKLVF